MRAVYRWLPPALAAGLLVFALSVISGAEPPEQPKRSPGDKQISDLVKTLINRGADLNNKFGDPRGCFRFYQGGLIALRPQLANHPDLQKVIDTGLADAEKAPSPYQQAYVLNQTLHRIYRHFNPKKASAQQGPPRDKNAPEKLPGPRDTGRPPVRPPVEKPARDTGRPPVKPPADKAPAPKDKGVIEKPNPTSVAGKVTFNGKPVAGGEIAFVSSSAQVYTAPLDKEGAYKIIDLDPGTYKVTVENGKPAVPKKYSDSETTPLKMEVKKGENVHDIQLK